MTANQARQTKSTSPGRSKSRGRTSRSRTPSKGRAASKTRRSAPAAKREKSADRTAASRRKSEKPDEKKEEAKAQKAEPVVQLGSGRRKSMRIAAAQEAEVRILFPSYRFTKGSSPQLDRMTHHPSPYHLRIGTVSILLLE